MKPILPILLSLVMTGVSFAQNITVTKKRPPKIDISAYQKIAIGDIVSETGAKTTRSMDLSDALTSQLFNNSDGHEIIDRNALEQVLASQKNITVINETTVAALSKKVGSALMIVARIQNEKVYADHKTRTNGINGCPIMYYDELSGDMTAQVKIIDVKTGRMIFTNPVVQPIKIKTPEECTAYKIDVEPLLKQTAVKLAEQITRLMVPWQEDIELPFIKPMSLFKAPFKKLPVAIQYFQAGNNTAGLEVLKEYLDDTNMKPDAHEMAAYNYGVGLFIDNRYKEALDYFKIPKNIIMSYPINMIAKTQAEQSYEYQLTSKNKQPIKP